MPRKFVNFIAMAIASGIVLLMSRMVGGGPEASCEENLKRGFQALQLYALENDQRFPEAELWMTRIAPVDPIPLQCPAVKEGYGYAFNDRYSAAVIPGEGDDPRTLLYDSEKLERNAHDGLTSLASPERHKGKYNTITAVGQMKSFGPDR